MTALQISEEYRAFARLFRLRSFFGPDSDDRVHSPAAEIALHFAGGFSQKFRMPNPSWNPPSLNVDLEKILKIGERLLCQQISSATFTNGPLLPFRLLSALRNLRKDSTIIIKAADKNLGLVVLDKSWYLNEGLRQLSDPMVYSVVPAVPWDEIVCNLSSIIRRFRSVLKNVEPFLLSIPVSKALACAFYLLPKIHKPVLTGRPICSYAGYILEPASRVLHHLLLPILLQQPNHLTDSLSLLRELKHRRLPHDCWLFTFDVESLYPSIPTSAGLFALKTLVSKFFAPRGINQQLVDMICSLAKVVLQFHFLEFDGVFYKQIRGTAMGSNFAVAYACLFLCHLEEVLFSSMDSSPLIFFKRYIDDALGIWTGSLHSLQQFLTAYQNAYPEININPCISSSSAVLLDINFYKGPNFSSSGILSSQCHQKKLNAYQYILYKSWHPPHQKKAFVISELRRYLLRESEPSGFVRLKRLLFQRLRARGYPRRFLLHCFNKVSPKDKSALLQRVFAPKIRKRAPLVFKLDFSPSTRAMNLGASLNPELFRLCQKVPALRHIPHPRICWRNPRRLGTFLTRSRFFSQRPMPH
ncbi:uncharacterized protein LOC131047025 [Cryptomeria japonica]|uniref:uncharacterized protein LOC131047025 n=1 Tax=Cryptomeria japonica TaxID=3369 RepID=UPI0027D9D2EB|nr:uncharacterized protein LOC131047025 [Cryptomeria japonica]